MTRRMVIGHMTPFSEYSPLERQRRAAEIVRKALGDRPFIVVQPEPEWRPYEPRKAGSDAD